MNDQEINIAIAEACGWEILPRHIAGEYETTGTPPNWSDTGRRHQPVPSYTTDLNAMHEAVTGLSEPKRGYYNAELSKAAVGGRNLMSVVKEPEWIFKLINATARQRAEAFLRALGLWKENTHE